MCRASYRGLSELLPHSVLKRPVEAETTQPGGGRSGVKPPLYHQGQLFKALPRWP